MFKIPFFSRKEKQGYVFVVSSVLVFKKFHYCCKFVKLVKMIINQ